MDSKTRAALMADPRVMELVVEATVEGEVRAYGWGVEAGYATGYDVGWIEGYASHQEEMQVIGEMFTNEDPQIIERNALWLQYNGAEDPPLEDLTGL